MTYTTSDLPALKAELATVRAVILKASSGGAVVSARDAEGRQITYAAPNLSTLQTRASFLEGIIAGLEGACRPGRSPILIEF